MLDFNIYLYTIIMFCEFVQGMEPNACKKIGPTGSTRDKNSRENYCLEQQGIHKIMNHRLYYHGGNGEAYSPALPNYINPSRLPASLFSFNAVDIESSLFNIGANNLVEPSNEFTPSLKPKLAEINFFEPTKLIKDAMFIPLTNQRPIIF